MPTILVVEDNPIVARDLQNTLRRLGHAAPTVVASGEAAIDEAVALRPDLILMDVGLSGPLDGIDAARAIRARVEVPVVFMTALSDDATLRRAWEAGPLGYVLKPLEPRSLRAAIEMALHAHRLELLQRARARVHLAALGAVTDAVLTLGSDATLGYVNPAAEAMLGQSASLLVARAVAEVVTLRSDEGRLDLAALCAQLLSSGGVIELAPSTRLDGPAGESMAVAGSIRAVEDPRGEPEAVVIVLRRR